MLVDRIRSAIPLGLALAAALALGGCAASPSPTATGPGTSVGGSTATAGPIPSEIAYAMHQRATFGLRADEGWVRAVAANPRARVQVLDFPMLPEEEAAFEASQASYDDITAAVQGYAATVPEAFGGLYIDQSAHRVVALFTTEPEANRVAILARLGRFGPLQVRQVRYTEAELRDLQDRIPGELAGAWIGEIGAAWTGVGVDTINNRVELSISSANPAAPALVAAHLRVPADELSVVSDGTGVELMARGWVDVSVTVGAGASMPPGGWMLDWTGDRPGSCGGGDVGFGVAPGQVTRLPCTVGGWRIDIVDDARHVVASGHVKVAANSHVPLKLAVP